MKTLRDFLGRKEEIIPKKQLDIYLDDEVNNDPRKFCPECNSKNIIFLRVHDPDASHYTCISCGLKYAINYESRSELGAH